MGSVKTSLEGGLYYCIIIVTITDDQNHSNHQNDGVRRIQLQSGASSLAKHGGAYFSAVCWSMQDLIAAPGPYENQEPQKLVGIASAPTLFTTSTKHHGSR